MRIPFCLTAACVIPLILQAPAAGAASASSSATTHAHLTMSQRFANANTTHDGHLTLDQAKTGYPSVAKHFDAIDKDKKGYVTQDDIRGYYKSRRTLHHHPASAHNKPTNS